MSNKITLTLAAVALMFATACKKEVSETTTMDGDTTTVSTTEVTTPALPDSTDWAEAKAKAKADYEAAEAKVKEAVAKGDKKAEEAAKKLRDDAKSTWDKIEAGTKEAGQDLKEGYNEALEKAKID